MKWCSFRVHSRLISGISATLSSVSMFLAPWAFRWALEKYRLRGSLLLLGAATLNAFAATFAISKPVRGNTESFLQEWYLCTRKRTLASRNLFIEDDGYWNYDNHILCRRWICSHGRNGREDNWDLVHCYSTSHLCFSSSPRTSLQSSFSSRRFQSSCDMYPSGQFCSGLVNLVSREELHECPFPMPILWELLLFTILHLDNFMLSRFFCCPCFSQRYAFLILQRQHRILWCQTPKVEKAL